MSDTGITLSNLIARYAELIDHGDFAGVADLLGQAAVGAGDSGSLVTGRDALLALFTSTTRLYPDGTPKTKHVMTNVIVDVTRVTLGACRAQSALPCSRSSAR